MRTQTFIKFKSYIKKIISCFCCHGQSNFGGSDGTLGTQQSGVSRSISEKPPTHFTLKIDSFSLLMKNSIERYESREFEAGGYKWTLVVHPNGNKSKNVKQHLSVYLAMSGSNNLSPDWEVYVVVKLFILDQNNDNYVILQDPEGKERRFHGPRREWGFDQFIALKEFNDAGNGFLVDDTCVFGAEVFIFKERAKDQGECLRMIKDPITFKHTFKVDNYSELGEFTDSNEFSAANQKWKIRLWPDGKGAGFGTHLSVSLSLAAPTALTSGGKIYAEYTLRVLNQVNSNHAFVKACEWFNASGEQHGWSRYMTLSYFKNSGFLHKDTCIIEAEIAVHGIVGDL